MLVREVMTRSPETLKPSDTLSYALELMIRFDIRELPVVKDDRLVGIITDRDIKMLLGPGASTVDESLLSEAALDIEVSEVMTADPETIAPNTGLSSACRILVEFRIGALPVVNPEQGKLVGILSVTDCLAQAAALFEELE